MYVDQDQNRIRIASAALLSASLLFFVLCMPLSCSSGHAVSMEVCLVVCLKAFLIARLVDHFSCHSLKSGGCMTSILYPGMIHCACLSPAWPPYCLPGILILPLCSSRGSARSLAGCPRCDKNRKKILCAKSVQGLSFMVRTRYFTR